MAHLKTPSVVPKCLYSPERQRSAGPLRFFVHPSPRPDTVLDWLCRLDNERRKRIKSLAAVTFTVLAPPELVLDVTHPATGAMFSTGDRMLQLRLIQQFQVTELPPQRFVHVTAPPTINVGYTLESSKSAGLNRWPAKVRLSLRKLTFSIVPNSDSAIVSILFLLFT
jgi:hypothetical protein